MSEYNPISLDEVRNFIKSGYIESTILSVVRDGCSVQLNCQFYLKGGDRKKCYELFTSRGRLKTFKTFDAACNFLEKLCIPSYTVYENHFFTCELDRVVAPGEC